MSSTPIRRRRPSSVCTVPCTTTIVNIIQLSARSKGAAARHRGNPKVKIRSSSSARTPTPSERPIGRAITYRRPPPLPREDRCPRHERMRWITWCWCSSRTDRSTICLGACTPPGKSRGSKGWWARTSATRSRTGPSTAQREVSCHTASPSGWTRPTPTPARSIRTPIPSSSTSSTMSTGARTPPKWWPPTTHRPTVGSRRWTDSSPTTSASSPSSSAGSPPMRSTARS